MYVCVRVCAYVYVCGACVCVFVCLCVCERMVKSLSAQILLQCKVGAAHF